MGVFKATHRRTWKRGEQRIPQAIWPRSPRIRARRSKLCSCGGKFHARAQSKLRHQRSSELGDSFRNTTLVSVSSAGPCPGQLKRATAGTFPCCSRALSPTFNFCVFYNVWFGSGGTASERNVRIGGSTPSSHRSGWRRVRCSRASAPGTGARAGDGLRGARRGLLGSHVGAGRQPGLRLVRKLGRKM